MEADFTEVEVTHIPKASHRILIGPKGATVKQLRKEFKCEIEIPEEASRHATIIVGGKAANVSKCIAKMDQLVGSGEGPEKAASKAAGSAGKTSAGAAATPTIAVSVPFSFEKASHAKLRGPRDTRRHELEKFISTAVERSVFGKAGSSRPIVKAQILFPDVADLTNTMITVDVSFFEEAPSSTASSAQTSLKEGNKSFSASEFVAEVKLATSRAVAQFLVDHKLSHHARDLDCTALLVASSSNKDNNANESEAAAIPQAKTSNEEPRSSEKAEVGDAAANSNNTAAKGSSRGPRGGGRGRGGGGAAAASSEKENTSATPVSTGDRVVPTDGGAKKRNAGRARGDSSETMKDKSPAVADQQETKNQIQTSSSLASASNKAPQQTTATKLYRLPANPFKAESDPKATVAPADPFIVLASVLKPNAPQRALFASM